MYNYFTIRVGLVSVLVGFLALLRAGVEGFSERFVGIKAGDWKYYY
jgi:hypothetical protein